MQSLVLILFFHNSEISHLLLSFINNIQRFIFSWGIIWSQFHIASNSKHVRRFRSRFKHYGKFIKFTFKHNIKLQINNKNLFQFNFSITFSSFTIGAIRHFFLLILSSITANSKNFKSPSLHRFCLFSGKWSNCFHQYHPEQSESVVKYIAPDS